MKGNTLLEAICKASKQVYQYKYNQPYQIQVVDNLIGGAGDINQAYSTFIEQNYMGSGVGLLTLVQAYQNWLNNETGVAPPDSNVSNQFKKYTIENYKMSIKYTNNTNSNAIIKAWKLVPRHDIPTTFTQYFGAPNAPTSLSNPDPQSLWYDGYLQMDQSAASRHTTAASYYKDAEPTDSPTLVKWYKVTKKIVHTLRPGKSITIHARMPKTVVEGLKFGGYPGTTASASVFAWRKLFKCWLVKIHGIDVHYPTNNMLAMTLPLLNCELNYSAEVYSLTSQVPTYTYNTVGWGTGLISAGGAPVIAKPYNDGITLTWNGAAAAPQSANYIGT